MASPFRPIVALTRAIGLQIAVYSLQPTENRNWRLAIGCRLKPEGAKYAVHLTQCALGLAAICELSTVNCKAMPTADCGFQRERYNVKRPLAGDGGRVTSAIANCAFSSYDFLNFVWEVVRWVRIKAH
jgi:hypothetical protein